VSMSEDWFEEVYKKNMPRLVKYAEGYFCDHAMAQDLAHEAFIVLITASRFNVTIQKPGRYLMITLKNIIGSELQKAERRRVEQLEAWHESYMVVEDKDKMEHYLPNWMTDQEKQFLLWWLDEGRTLKEVGEMIGCSENACYTRMNRLRAKFKKREQKSIFYA